MEQKCPYQEQCEIRKKELVIACPREHEECMYYQVKFNGAKEEIIFKETLETRL